jgi:amino acid transporter
MYNIIKTSHSHLAYLALAAIIIAIIVNLIAYIGKKPYGKIEKMTALFGLIGVHIQLLLGMILYFTSPYGLSNLSGETMKNSFDRLLALEHPLTNLIAIVLITVGYSRAKKTLNSKPVVIFYIIGLLLLLSRIPWSIWPK